MKIKKTERMLIFYIQFNHNKTGTVFSNLSQIQTKSYKKKWMNRNTDGKKKLFQQSSKNKPDFTKTSKEASMFLNTESFKLVRV